MELTHRATAIPINVGAVISQPTMPKTPRPDQTVGGWRCLRLRRRSLLAISRSNCSRSCRVSSSRSGGAGTLLSQSDKTPDDFHLKAVQSRSCPPLLLIEVLELALDHLAQNAQAFSENRVARGHTHIRPNLDQHAFIQGDQILVAIGPDKCHHTRNQQRDKIDVTRQ